MNCYEATVDLLNEVVKGNSLRLNETKLAALEKLCGYIEEAAEDLEAECVDVTFEFDTAENPLVVWNFETADIIVKSMNHPLYKAANATDMIRFVQDTEDLIKVEFISTTLLEKI